MKSDVRDFLSHFEPRNLVQRGILYRHPEYNYRLTGRSVRPLIQLMKDFRITCLEATNFGWFLTSDGRFCNPHSNESCKRGRIDALKHLTNVINGQNKSINPYFKDIRSKIDNIYGEATPHNSMEITLFLKRFTVDELVSRGVLTRDRNAKTALTGKNLTALIALMREMGVSYVWSTGRRWHLTTGYEFHNSWSEEKKGGDARQLSDPANVFRGQNRFINPYCSNSYNRRSSKPLRFEGLVGGRANTGGKRMRPAPGRRSGLP